MSAPTVVAPCGCPQHPGRRITDPVLHAAWHARVVAQGGPVGVVNTHTLRAARHPEETQ